MENPLKIFKKLLELKLPASTVTLDPPDAAAGSWWVDVAVGKKRVTLEYRPEMGFGIFHVGAGYGEGPSEVYRTPELAVKRVSQLMGAVARATPGLTLKEMRELLDRSQVELAGKMGIKQPAICRFEGRKEVKLGTLDQMVRALGGRLEVRAHFSDANVALSVKD